MKPIKSRNFDTQEVVHRNVPEELEPNAYFLQGVLQVLRDACTIKYGKNVRIVLISGYRPPEVNAELENAADNSNHMWANDEEDFREFKVAADIYSPDLPPQLLYSVAKTLIRGEVYYDVSDRKVHIAPCGRVKQPWVQP